MFHILFIILITLRTHLRSHSFTIYSIYPYSILSYEFDSNVRPFTFRNRVKSEEAQSVSMEIYNIDTRTYAQNADIPVDRF